MGKNITFYGYATEKINELLSESNDPIALLSQILCRSKEYARDLLLGKVKPANNDIYAICSYYNITIDEFLDKFGVA